MYQEVYTIVGAVFLPILYLYILKVPHYVHKVTGIKLGKPLNCGFCLSFWLALISFSLKTNFINAIFISSGVPFLYLLAEYYITNNINYD